MLSHGRKVCHIYLAHLLLFLLKIVMWVLIFSSGYFWHIAPITGRRNISTDVFTAATSVKPNMTIFQRIALNLIKSKWDNASLSHFCLNHTPAFLEIQDLQISYREITVPTRELCASASSHILFTVMSQNTLNRENKFITTLYSLRNMIFW